MSGVENVDIPLPLSYNAGNQGVVGYTRLWRIALSCLAYGVVPLPADFSQMLSLTQLTGLVLPRGKKYRVFDYDLLLQLTAFIEPFNIVH